MFYDSHNNSNTVQEVYRHCDVCVVSVCGVHELYSYYGDYIVTHCDRRSFVAFGVVSSLKCLVLYLQIWRE